MNVCQVGQTGCLVNPSFPWMPSQNYSCQYAPTLSHFFFWWAEDGTQVHRFTQPAFSESSPQILTISLLKKYFFCSVYIWCIYVCTIFTYTQTLMCLSGCIHIRVHVCMSEETLARVSSILSLWRPRIKSRLSGFQGKCLSSLSPLTAVSLYADLISSYESFV